MVQIKSTGDRDLDKLSQEHYDSVKLSITRKINGLKGKQWLKDFLNKNLATIIKGRPKELISINRKYKLARTKNSRRPALIDNAIKEVFDYNWLAGNKKRSYDFAQRLQVNTCPYCNRNYTVTVLEQGNGIVRPDFDHFFAKSKFPLLALSFYNLIPSCPICNRSIKGSQETVYNKYIHPYEESYDAALKINYVGKDADSMIGVKRNLEITVLLAGTDKRKAKRCNNSFKLFKLKEIYQFSHLDEIADIIRKYHVSGGTYLEVLHKQFKQLGTLPELYKIGFANYYNEEDFGKRPLAKLTKDIVEQLSFVIPKIK
jgi:hypothetical protein